MFAVGIIVDLHLVFSPCFLNLSKKLFGVSIYLHTCTYINIHTYISSIHDPPSVTGYATLLV